MNMNKNMHFCEEFMCFLTCYDASCVVYEINIYISFACFKCEKLHLYFVVLVNLMHYIAHLMNTNENIVVLIA